MSAFQGWVDAVLGYLHAPATAENRQLLTAWQRAEGGTAKFNPLNTTLKVAGSSSYNSVGVQNYPDANTGAYATAHTLLGDTRYGGIVADLRRGDVAPAQVIAGNESGFKTWGTGAANIFKLLGTSAVSSIESLIRPASSSVNLNQVDPSLLGRLYALASSLGRSLTITSGYRTPSQSEAAGGSRTDPHTKGIAADVLLGGKPIGDVVPVATLARYGLVGGNSAGFWPGHDAAYPHAASDPAGADPVHVQLAADAQTPGFDPAAQLASTSKLGWVERVAGWITDPVGSVVDTVSGGAVDKVLHVGGDANPFNWVGDVESWLQDKIGYAVVYALLVAFSLVLAVLGVLALLGINPRTAAAGGAARLAVAA